MNARVPFPSKVFRIDNYCERCGVEGRPIDISRLRELRLWHWTQAVHAAKRIIDNRSTKQTRESSEHERAFHMRAAQTLNDLFPIGDTAESDYYRKELPQRTR